MTDAELPSVNGTSYISTLRERSSSVIRASINSTVQCVEFTYKMAEAGGFVYVGGSPSSDINPFVAAPFKTWGAVFTNATGSSEWQTGKTS